MRFLLILGYRLANVVRHVYWFVLRPRTTGVKCVIVHGNRWLMVRHTYGRRVWTFPGGAVKRAETTEQAIRREVREELGIILGDVREMGSFAQARRLNSTMTAYLATVDSPAFEVDGVEVAEARWVDPDHLPDRIARGTVEIIAAVPRER